MSRYTLLDDPYYEAMLRVSEILGERELVFCLVGGGAAQAWIASLRTGSGERRLAEDPLLKTALRKTRDLDFSTHAHPTDMLVVLNELAASLGSGAHVLSPRALRLGQVSVSFTIEASDLSGMADLYDRFLDSRCMLRLRRRSEPDEVPTIGLAELLATKLTRRGDKAKDIVDVVQLLSAARDAGRLPNLEAVRSLIRNRPDALELLDDIVGRTSEEG